MALNSPLSALDFIAARPDLFAHQGSVAATWRRRGGNEYGPYYRLRYRENGVLRSLYLGRQSALVDRVRDALRALQAPLRQQRAFQELRRRVVETLRLDRHAVDAQLRRLGLRLKGFEVRGWRTSPLAMLLRARREESRRLTASLRPKNGRLPRVRQLRFALTGRAGRWIREHRPKIPCTPVVRLETFLNARDARQPSLRRC